MIENTLNYVTISRLPINLLHRMIGINFHNAEATALASSLVLWKKT